MSLSEILEHNFLSIFKKHLKTERLIIWIQHGSWRTSHAKLCWYSISECKNASDRFPHDIFGVRSNEINYHSSPSLYFHLVHESFMRKCGRFLLKFRFTMSTKLGIGKWGRRKADSKDRWKNDFDVKYHSISLELLQIFPSKSLNHPRNLC